jgi:putative nucleotidyltransferase with HDIG domain
VSEFPVRARIFFYVYVTATVLILAVYWNTGNVNTDITSLLASAFIIGANILSDRYRIFARSGLTVTISTSINFASTLLFGPGLAATSGATGCMVSDILFKKAWYKVVFNSANTAMPVIAGGTVYGLLNDGSTVPLGSINNAMALALAGCVYLVVNVGFLCTMVALVENHGPLELLKSSYWGLGFQMITLIPLGTLFVLIYQQSPWGLALTLFPIVLTYYSFQLYQRLRTESKQTIELLADAVDERDRYTFQHSMRVGEIVEKIARKMGMDIQDIDTLVFAARIHDLGKIGIPSSVLLKEGKLTPEERQIIEQHPAIGAKILSQMSTYDAVRDLIVHHHERVDGKGYPSGLDYERIPVGARILAVADAFEAMTSDRPYRKALPLDVAIGELERGRGTQFDPTIVDHFIAVLAEEKQASRAFNVDLRPVKKES